MRTLKNKYFYGAIILLLFTFILVSCGKDNDDNTLFDLVKEEISLPSETTTNINLPTKSEAVPEADLYWTTDNFFVINNKGFLFRPDTDTVVNFELIVTIGIDVQVFKYQVKAIGWEDQTLSLDTFKDPQGFASLGITNRKGQTENFYEANDELEFLEALVDSKDKKNVIIKINNDLNLGAKYVGRLLQEKGLWDGVNPKDTPYLDGKVFRENTNKPVNHPTLLRDGVGQLIIEDKDGLMIYSEKGVTINHLTVHIKGSLGKGSNNIVFRNLEMRGIWEWDEIDRGDYKSLDWDYFTVERARNIWIDHVTFRTSYDGIMDIKGDVSNITLSWLNLDFIVDDFIEDQFTYLEENINSFPFYRELRETVKMEDIATVAAGQKKAFNWGNTESGPGFESITVTMHHVYAKNLQDRFPRLRRGDVHTYNLVLDSEDLRRLRHIDMKVISQAMVPTEQGAILMENSRFIGVSQPIKTHQSNNLDEDFTGRFKIIDSEYFYGNDYYYGSSDDNDVFNPWIRSNQNITYDLPFFFRNYENVPYEYQMQDANKLTKVFKDNPIGAGLIPGFDWLEITNLIDINTVDKGIKIDEKNIKGLDKYIAKMGEPLKTFTPELYNYYSGVKLRDDNVKQEYTYYVNSNNVNVNTPGIYEIEYTFILTHNNEEVKYYQTYIVYDSAGPNEIYDSNISTPFDNILSGELSLYEDTGTIYMLLSNNKNESSESIIENGVANSITNTTYHFNDLDVTDYSYIHFVTINEDKRSEVFTKKLIKETLVEIYDFLDFNAMLIDYRSSGKYYKLMNDIDFTDRTLYNLNSENIFSGVFDGNGYTLKNLYRHAYGGGIFHTIRNGKVKDVTFDNIIIDIHRTEIFDEETNEFIGWQNTSAGAGVVAGKVNNGFAYFENITIKNSKVISDNNYSSILVGRVESFSDVVINNIVVLDSEVDQDGEYAGGITAGLSNNSDAIYTNIYINNLKVSERGTKMAGIIIGRAESNVTLENIVVLNAKIDTNGNAAGGIFAKDDRKGQQIYTTLNNVFIDLEIVGELIPNQRGSLIGNPDLPLGHPPIVMDNPNSIWGTPFVKGSTAINAPNEIELVDVNNAWWEAHFGSMLLTDLWEIQNDLLVLKR